MRWYIYTKLYIHPASSIIHHHPSMRACMHTYIHTDTFIITLHYTTYITIQYIPIQSNTYITCITLFYIILQYNTIQHNRIHYITLHYITSHHITLHYITSLHCNTIKYSYDTLHYITITILNTMQCNTLQYTTLHIFLT